MSSNSIIFESQSQDTSPSSQFLAWMYLTPVVMNSYLQKQNLFIWGGCHRSGWNLAGPVFHKQTSSLRVFHHLLLLSFKNFRHSSMWSLECVCIMSFLNRAWAGFRFPPHIITWLCSITYCHPCLTKCEDS